MEEQQRNIDEAFRQSLSDYRESPPGAVWQDIASRLDAEDGRRRKGFFLRWPWVALSLLLIVSGTMMVVGLNKNNDGEITKTGSIDITNKTGEVSIQSIQQAPTFSASNIEANPQTEQPANEAEQPIPQVGRPVPKADQVVPMEVAAKPAPAIQLAGDEPATIPSAPASAVTHAPLKRNIQVTAVAMPAPPVVVAPRKSEALVRLHARNTKAATTIAKATVAAPSAKHIETDRIPVIIAERRPQALARLQARNKQATTAVVKATVATPLAKNIETDRVPVIKPAPKPDALARLSARSTRAATTVLASTIVAPSSKNIEADRIPVIIPEPQAAAPAAEPAAVPAHNTGWNRPEPESVSGITTAQAKDPIKAHQATVPEKLFADNSPLPAAYVMGEKREIIPEDEPEPIPQSQAPSVVVKNSQPARTVSAMPVPVSAAAVAAPTQQSTPTPVAEDKAPEQVTPNLSVSKTGFPLSLAAFVGYEYGFSSLVQTRYAASLRLLWHASQTIAIGLQPAFRMGNLATTSVNDPRSYYRSSIHVDSLHTYDQSPTVRYAVDSIYNYVVHETYDSIYVQGRTAGGSFWELELPLVLRLNLGKSWYTYGGPSINIGGKLSYSTAGSPQVFTTIRKDSLAQSQQLPIEAFNGYFGKSSLESYDSYKPTESPSTPPVRVGYLFGVGYAWKNVLAEASVHQQLSGFSDVAPGLKDVYATPSIRVSVGYLLFSPKRKVSGIAE